MALNQGPVKLFNYRGQVPGSKSILNRLLICASYSQEKFEIWGDSACEDVELMRQGLKALGLVGEQNATEAVAEPGDSVAEPVVRSGVDCGSGGTTLRFLTLKASRLPGHWVLTGTKRLFSRPQGALIDMAQALGVSLSLQKLADESETPKGEGLAALVVDSRGWQKPQGPLLIDASLSSQFLSAVVLNAWGLPFELKLHVVGAQTSRGYWEMTKKLVTDLGMELEERQGIGPEGRAGGGQRESPFVQDLPFCEIVIPPGQQVKKTSFVVEPDMSSAFTVAALAALGGQVELLNFPGQSLQPDAVFVELLQQMGVKVELGEVGLLRVQGDLSKALRPLTVNLESCPDLFPVLAVLCALAPGRSHLFGAPQLVHKESNRIAKVAELLTSMGRDCEPTADGMWIEGRGLDLSCLGASPSSTAVSFDPDQDHRLAFAAALAAQAGFAIEVSDPSVVNKSFPEFWQVMAEGRGRGRL